jgi:hypothetical protein
VGGKRTFQWLRGALMMRFLSSPPQALVAQCQTRTSSAKCGAMQGKGTKRQHSSVDGLEDYSKPRAACDLRIRVIVLARMLHDRKDP